MSEWGPPCISCGHPASYHGVTFCQVMAGAEFKRQCDCAGYLHPSAPPPLTPPQGARTAFAAAARVARGTQEATK